jgi:hypothetical protein
MIADRTVWGKQDRNTAIQTVALFGVIISILVVPNVSLSRLWVIEVHGNVKWLSSQESPGLRGGRRTSPPSPPGNLLTTASTSSVEWYRNFRLK